MTDKTFIKHTSCPSCGSKDNVGVWETEEGKYQGHCFGCEKNFYWDSLDDEPSERRGKPKMDGTPPKKTKWGIKAISDRGISKEAAEKFQVKTSKDGDYVFPYYDSVGDVGWAKYRSPDKKFSIQKLKGQTFSNAMLFGSHLFPAGKKATNNKFERMITIVEGEFDALAAWELMGKKGGVVSLLNGAQSVKQMLKNPDNYEYLNSFDTIVVCLDNDEPGKKATKELCAAFHPKKIKLFPHQPGFKDANDYLEQKMFKKFNDLWWKAEPYREDGIVGGDILIDRIVNRPPSVCYRYPYDGLNDKTFGMRMSEMVTLTAMTGVGKTQLYRELTYSFLTDPDPVLFKENLPEDIQIDDLRIGILSIEESPDVSLEGLASLHMHQPLHLPDTPRDDEAIRGALKELVYDDEGECRVYFYDQFGSNDVENIISKVWFMVKGLDCNVIVLDHINMIVSDQRQDDERRALDEIATKLKQMTKDLNINLHIVAHQNREGNIRGTAAIEQLSNVVIYSERDLDEEDDVKRNTTTVSVKKCRFSGRTGPAAWLFFNEETSRMEEVDEPLDGDL